MNLFKTLSTQVHGVITQLQFDGVLPRELDVTKVDVQPPKDLLHGDIAVNAAMVLAAQSGKKPRDIAEAMIPLLFDLEMVEHAEIAGPGFINLRLNPSVFQHLLIDILNVGMNYGDSEVGNKERVNVEYVSANPTGPMHVGHARGAVVGDALARLLLKAGFAVTKEYYINDAGAQVDKLADSAFLRYREALGEAIEIPEGLYPGDYLVPVGKALAQEHGAGLLDLPREKWLPLVRQFTLSAMMQLIKDDLAQLGIVHEVFSSERKLADAGKVEEAIAALEKKGLIYTGVLEPPKGKVIEDWEPRPQTLFKSTQFGDDCDRPIKKSDGSWTYFAPDIALHYDKIQRGFTTLVDIFGVDHGGYVKRISAAVAALSDGKVTTEVKLCQLVKFMRRGEPLKMSKRAGTFITVREVVDEVGKDVLRFMMLTRKNDMPLDFDFEKVQEQSKDNAVFYVQYAHARCKSVLRLMEADVPEAVKLGAKPTPELLAKLNTKDELQLIKKIADFPRMIEGAATSFEPHRIAFYLVELAAEFHSLWNKGNEQNTLRFIVKDDIKLTAARAALATALAFTIASGLDVLGVEAAEELRA